MEQLLDSINWQLIAPLLLIWLALIVSALISCMRAEETNGPKWMWILIIVFVNMIGPIAYFIVGRKQH